MSGSWAACSVTYLSAAASSTLLSGRSCLTASSFNAFRVFASSVVENALRAMTMHLHRKGYLPDFKMSRYPGIVPPLAILASWRFHVGLWGGGLGAAGPPR